MYQIIYQNIWMFYLKASTKIYVNVFTSKHVKHFKIIFAYLPSALKYSILPNIIKQK